MSAFYDEVFQQPEAVESLLANVEYYRQKVRGLFPLPSQRVVFFGMGSSLYASVHATYLLRMYGIDADAYDASEGLWYISNGWFDNVSVVVLVSNSGETVEILRLLERLKGSHAVKVGFTSNLKSALAKGVDLCFDIFSGEEKALGSTKSYTNSVLALVVFSLLLVGRLDGEVESLRALPSELARVLKLARDSVDDLPREVISSADGGVITTRGFGMSMVYQASLTFGEIARLNLLPISAGMLRHGPMEMMVERRGIICFVPDSANKELLVKLCREVSPVSSFCWIVANSLVDTAGLESGSVFMDIVNTDLPEYLQGLLFLVYMQLFAYRVRKTKGISDEEFEMINKVTREE